MQQCCCSVLLLLLLIRDLDAVPPLALLLSATDLQAQVGTVRLKLPLTGSSCP